MNIKISFTSKEQTGVTELVKLTASWHGSIVLDFQKGTISLSNLKKEEVEQVVETMSKFFVITNIESESM